jgi:hypothetical protein
MWLLNSICAGLLDPFQYILSDEAWFHLSGHVNPQNTRYWAAENPHLLHEQPLQDKKNRCLVCCVRDAHHWTHIFCKDCQYGSLIDHFWRILCSTSRRRKTSFSSSRTGRHAALLRCPCSEFLTCSLRNERLANICGRHILLTLQHATIFSGETWKVRYTNQICTRYRNWGQQQPRNCNHQKHYFTSGIPQHD